MSAKNMLKGRIAESLVEELLRSAENHVYRFGYEFVFQNIRTIADLDNKIGIHIKTFPDFLVITAKGRNPYFVEVRFRMEPKWNEDILDDEKLERLNEFWKPRLILVNRSEPPYFRITEPPRYNLDIGKNNESSAISLYECEEFNMKSLGEKTIKYFDDLVKKYFPA